MCALALQKFWFGVLGRRRTGFSPPEDAAAVKVKTEEGNAVGRTELVILWGRAAACCLCSGSMVRHSLELWGSKLSDFQQFSTGNTEIFISRLLCEKWCLAFGNVVFH